MANLEESLKIRAVVIDELASSDLFSVADDMGTENISGVNAYHYLLEMDINKLPDFMEKLTGRLAVEGLIPGQPAITENDLEVLEGVAKPEIEVWIGTEDFLLRKVVLKPYMIPISGEGDTGSLEGSVVFSSLNKPVTIEVPANLLSPEEFEKLMQGIFGGLMRDF